MPGNQRDVTRPDGSTRDDDPGRFSTSLARGLAILAEFSPERRELGISDLASALDMHPSTVHRYVSTLLRLGYLDQDRLTKRYRLGVKVVHLGLSALSSMDLADVAQPYLESLKDRTRQTVSLGVLDDMEVMDVVVIRSPGGINMNTYAGSRFPLHCSSMGKVLLAYLPDDRMRQIVQRLDLVPAGPGSLSDRSQLLQEIERVREVGYGLNDQELAFGLRSIAAPVRSASGEVVAAVNVSVHATMFSMEDLVEAQLPPLREIVDLISAKLGFRGQG